MVVDFSGVNIKKTANGFDIQLTGDLYKKIGNKVANGQLTKEFYHELKKFIKIISEFKDLD